jgi:hypothetical protein
VRVELAAEHFERGGRLVIGVRGAVDADKRVPAGNPRQERGSSAMPRSPLVFAKSTASIAASADGVTRRATSA